MKRSATLPVVTLGLMCAAPVAYVAFKQSGATLPSLPAFSSLPVEEPSEPRRGRSVLPDRESEAEAGSDQDEPARTSTEEAKTRAGLSLAGLLEQARTAIETHEPARTSRPAVHEPRLSVYDTAGNCTNDGKDREMCSAAYRDARHQSERSSDMFDDLDACEHRYGERSCYERRQRTDLTVGGLLYMPIMAGFALVTDGRQMLARPIYRCPPRITIGNPATRPRPEW